MTSRLAVFASRLTEVGYLAALMVVPLFFNVFSQRVFEPEKLSLLRSIALVMLAGVAVKLVEDGRIPGVETWRRWLATPMILPTVVLTLCYFISTMTSIVPWISLTGGYNRLQGLYTWMAYIVLFACILDRLRDREDLDRFVHALVLPSLPIALYGVVQKFGVDPMPWLGDVTTRVASTMGNAIFVAAYLIMVIPMTLVLLVRAFQQLDEDDGNAAVLRVAGYLVMFIVQLVAVVLSASRGPQIGGMAGLFFVGLLLAALRGSRRVMLSILVLGVAGAAFLVIFNLPNSPLAPLRAVPYLGRLGQIFETSSGGTGEVRVLIWEGAARLIVEGEGKDPVRRLFGFGPESMQVSYNPYYPPKLGNIESRNASPDRAHNEVWDTLNNLGLVGMLAYLFFYTSLFYFALRWLSLITSRRDLWLFLGLWFGCAVAAVIGFYMWRQGPEFFGVALPVGMMLGLFIYILIRTLMGFEVQRAPGTWVLVGAFAGYVAHFFEIHFGIAIAATRTLSFALLGVMVVVGALGATRPELFALVPSKPDVPVPPSQTRKSRTMRQSANRPKSASRTHNSPLWTWLSNGMMIATALSTMSYAFIVRPEPTFKDVAVTIWLFGLGWLLMSLILTTDTLRRMRQMADGGVRAVLSGMSPTGGIGAYVLVSILIPVVYALIHFSTLRSGQQAASGADTSATLLTMFYGWLFLLLCAWAWVLDRGTPAPAAMSTGNVRWLAYPVILLAALAMAFSTNLSEVRADVFFKEAEYSLATTAAQRVDEGKLEEGRALYDRSMLRFNQALELDGKEDFYLLFKGKSQLEKAESLSRELASDVQQAGMSPDASEYDNPATKDKAIQRDAWYEDAMKTLKVAYETAPLNTDHAANLARAYRFWALGTNDLVRRTERFAEARKWFATATSLSPNNAGLKNEAAVTEYQDGKTDAALALLDLATKTDPQFLEPYRLMGNIARDREDWPMAEEAYRKLLGVSGTVTKTASKSTDVGAWSALAFVEGKEKKLAEAKLSNLKVLELAPNDTSTLRNLAIISRDLGENAAGCTYVQRGMAADPSDGTFQSLASELGCTDLGMNPTTPASGVESGNPLQAPGTIPPGMNPAGAPDQNAPFVINSSGVTVSGNTPVQPGQGATP